MGNQIDYQDISIPELIAQIKMIMSKGWTVHVKFTCLNCGSRQTCEEPNCFHVKEADVPFDEMVGKYHCENCDTIVYPTKFGLLAAKDYMRRK